jgi:hypothetical protein
MAHKPYENPKTGYKKQAIPTDIRWAVWERDDFRCQECGARRYLTIDHIHPESAGGDLSPDNLQTLCWPCNRKKNTRLPGTSAESLTWQELVYLRPELGELLEEIRQVEDNPAKPSFCANAVWYGFLEYRGRGFKARMKAALDTKESDGLVAKAAYDLAYKTLYAALPGCRNCACG